MNVFIGDLFADVTAIASSACLVLIDRLTNEFCLCVSYNLPVQEISSPTCLTHMQ